MVNKKKQNKKPDTTGHNWDGIEEYNVPAPRWWLIVWIICIIWAVGYWVFYPTWPTKSGNSKGILNWTQQSQLAKSQEEINVRKAVHLKKFANSSFSEIQKSPELMKFALQGGKIAFKENCAACHGTGGNGGKGFPNLRDDDWLWGGKVEDIYKTLLYGIRSNHAKARISQMPAFGADEILTRAQIKDVTEYVLSLSGRAHHNENGEKVFKENCASCHGKLAKGNRSLGAPNLSDQIWLYGDDKSDLFKTIYYSRAGVMPAWKNRLDEQTIRQLALYVHSFGGGE